MRTTLNIDSDLLKDAKIAAIRDGITLTAYIERALAREREHPLGEANHREPPPPPARWKPLTFAGQPDPDFPWTGSYSKILEYVEGPDARP